MGKQSTVFAYALVLFLFCLLDGCQTTPVFCSTRINPLFFVPDMNVDFVCQMISNLAIKIFGTAAHDDDATLDYRITLLNVMSKLQSVSK